MYINMLVAVLDTTEEGYLCAVPDGKNIKVRGELLDIGSTYYLQHVRLHTQDLIIDETTKIYKVQVLLKDAGKYSEAWRLVNDEKVTVAEFAKYLAKL